jgi:hypothetical protein
VQYWDVTSHPLLALAALFSDTQIGLQGTLTEGEGSLPLTTLH